MSTMNKAARAALAKETIHTLVPKILASTPRAQKGVQSSQLLRGHTDLPKLDRTVSQGDGQNHTNTASEPHLPIRLIQSDTLDAAQKLQAQYPNAKIAILNMASPLQPGGGVLRGAKAQEESLCMRSTLYPSLRPEWYRHPSDAVIYTPDVLVFKSAATPEMEMLPVKDRFYVDVISCAAPRHPETGEISNGDGEKERRYADPKDEEMMSLKIKFIMRTAAKMGVSHLVLGALGCGAYRNPIAQVANIMRKCLVGKGKGRPSEEDWRGAGIEQVVFAILDDSTGKLVWKTFIEEFQDYAQVVEEILTAPRATNKEPLIVQLDFLSADVRPLDGQARTNTLVESPEITYETSVYMKEPATRCKLRVQLRAEFTDGFESTRAVGSKRGLKTVFNASAGED